MPAGIKKAQEVMQALGPATPLVFVLVAYLAILVFGTLFSHLLSKSYLVLPIMFAAPSRLKIPLIAGVVVGSIAGYF